MGDLDSGWWWAIAAFRSMTIVYFFMGFNDPPCFIFAGVASFFDLVVCTTVYQKKHPKPSKPPKG